MDNQLNLQQLYELRQKGIISEKEYQALSVGPKHFTVEKPLNDDTRNLPLLSYFLYCMTEKYFKIEGRARRKEFFGFILGYITFLLGLLLLSCFIPLFFLLFIAIKIINFIFIPPAICLTIRRMHDVGFSAWWILIPIVPCILVFLPSNKTANKFGEIPRGIKKI